MPTKTKAKAPLPKGAFKLPRMVTRKFWVGAYGGHYDIVVLFKNKPTHTTIEQNIRHASDWEHPKDSEIIDMLAEQSAGNIAADMGTGNFEEYFPGVDLSPIMADHGRPRAIEIFPQDLMQVQLTVPVSQDGRLLESIEFHADWS